MPHPRADELATDGSVTVSIHVGNAGDRDGVEVVQLYLHDPVASAVRPVQRLIAYARVPLAVGERARVSFEVPADLASFTGVDGRRIVEPGELVLGFGRSSAEIVGTRSVRVVGETRVVDHTRALHAVVAGHARRLTPRPDARPERAPGLRCARCRGPDPFRKSGPSPDTPGAASIHGVCVVVDPTFGTLHTAARGGARTPTGIRAPPAGAYRIETETAAETDPCTRSEPAYSTESWCSPLESRGRWIVTVPRSFSIESGGRDRRRSVVDRHLAGRTLDSPSR